MQGLRNFRNDVLWLTKHASPDAWRQGIEAFQSDAAQARPHRGWLPHYIQAAMPTQEATAMERAELETLIALICEAPEIRGTAMYWALKNPPWQIHCWRRLVAQVSGAGAI